MRKRNKDQRSRSGGPSGAGERKGGAPAPPGEGAAPAWLCNRPLLAGLIFVFAFLLYANTLGHEYAQDDAIVITDNMFTAQGVKGIPGILTYDTFYGFFKEEGKARLVTGGRYRPMSLLTFALEVELFGQKPGVSHLVNALLYALTAVVLYLLLLQLLRPGQRRPVAGYTAALLGALIFAAHPLHVEVVANIKGRDEILALLGSLGALSLTLRAYEKQQAGWSLAAGFAFLLALFSKENAITFLAVVPLAFYFFTRAGAGVVLRLWLPYVAAAALFLFVRGEVLGWSLGAPAGELMNNPFLKVEGNRYVPFTPAERLATIVYTLGRYLQLLLFPHPLTHDYYPRHIGIMQWSDPLVWLSLLIYLGLAACAVWGLRRRDTMSFAILFFLATLSIVSNLFFAVGTNMSERLVYMPSVGYALAAGLLLGRLAGRGALVPALALGGLLTLGYGARTVTRNPAWHDNFTLFSTDIAVSANSAKLRNALGGELITQSQSAGITDETRKQRMLREAIGHLREAIRIHPAYKNAYLLLGNAHYYLRQWDEAIRLYEQAMALDPGYAEAAANLGIALRDAGRHYGEERGDLDRAVQYLERAYRQNAGDYETARLLGVAYGMRGDAAKAVELFTRAAELNPESADALYNLGSAHYNAGQPDRGAELHRRAREMDPEVEKRMRGE